MGTNDKGVRLRFGIFSTGTGAINGSRALFMGPTSCLIQQIFLQNWVPWYYFFFFLIGKKKYIQKTARCKLALAKQKYKNMEKQKP